MAIIKKMLKQQAVYWPLASETSDAYGQPVYDTAYQMKCRWEDVSVEFLKSDGTSKVSQAIVYVQSDVVAGGVLWLGTLADVPASLTDPKLNAGAFEIQRFEKLPDLKNKLYLRTAYL